MPIIGAESFTQGYEVGHGGGVSPCYFCTSEESSLFIQNTIETVVGTLRRASF